MQTKFIEKEIDAQNETITFWFQIGPLEYGIRESDAGVTVIAECGREIEDPVVQEQVRNLCPITDEMRAE